MSDFLREHGWWITTVSVLLLLISSVGAAILIVKVPADFFARPPAPPSKDVRAMVRKLSKNVFGFGLILLGGLMSVPLVPGPGLLLLMIGISLADFPGKRKLEQSLVRRPVVFRPANWLRSKFGAEPLTRPEQDHRSG